MLLSPLHRSGGWSIDQFQNKAQKARLPRKRMRAFCFFAVLLDRAAGDRVRIARPGDPGEKTNGGRT